ncbi:hypothetical protein ACFWDX_56815 [Streptomyces mirabilis]|uniref:hypothetical protein n=1 Tax=Streptomyces mirabilis TaxID=68239 RepID=UPI003661F11B
MVQPVGVGALAGAQDLGQGVSVGGVGYPPATWRRGDDAVRTGSAGERERLLVEQLPDLGVGDQVHVDGGRVRAALLELLDEPGPRESGVPDRLGRGAGEREVHALLAAVELQLADEHDGERALGGSGSPYSSKDGLRVDGVRQFDERGGRGARERGRRYGGEHGNHAARLGQLALARGRCRKEQRGPRSILRPVDLHLRTVSAGPVDGRSTSAESSSASGGACRPRAPIRLPRCKLRGASRR